MAEPFIGEIRMFAFNFAPRGWAFCDGQILPINQNQSLYSLLGTTYGGDGRTSFALPDLRGRVPMHYGGGYSLGQKGGAENVTITQTEMPSHNHGQEAYGGSGNEKGPSGHLPAKAGDGERNYSSATPDSSLKPTQSVGGGQSHDNMQPYLCIHWIIALQGLFPSRN